MPPPRASAGAFASHRAAGPAPATRPWAPNAPSAGFRRDMCVPSRPRGTAPGARYSTVGPICPLARPLHGHVRPGVTQRARSDRVPRIGGTQLPPCAVSEGTFGSLRDPEGRNTRASRAGGPQMSPQRSFVRAFASHLGAAGEGRARAFGAGPEMSPRAASVGAFASRGGAAGRALGRHGSDGPQMSPQNSFVRAFASHRDSGGAGRWRRLRRWVPNVPYAGRVGGIWGSGRVGAGRRLTGGARR